MYLKGVGLGPYCLFSREKWMPIPFKLLYVKNHRIIHMYCNSSFAMFKIDKKGLVFRLS